MYKVKVFKKEVNKIIYNNMNAENKINNKDIMLTFKDFEGKPNFNCKVQEFFSNKQQVELILLPPIKNVTPKKYYHEWTNYQVKRLSLIMILISSSMKVKNGKDSC